MSLYNMLFGENPFSGLLLDVLGTTKGAIPRYRDCYLDEKGRIVIHTRTGGGNREYYENEESCRDNYPEYWEGDPETNPSGPWNADLRKLPGFLYDRDDDGDRTYANFLYAVPEPFKEQFNLLQRLGAEVNPAERWQALLDKMRAGDTSDPVVARALAVGEEVMARLKKASEGGGPAVVEI